MAEGTYEYECMRAELLGVGQPDYDEFMANKKLEEEERLKAEAEDVENSQLANAEECGETLQTTAGKLDELNHILAATQKKIDRFKFRCGSVTEFVKTKIGSISGSSGGSEPSSTPNPTEQATNDEQNEELPPAEDAPADSQNGDTPRKSDLTKALDNHVDKLDAMLAKAEIAHISMNEQNKQMKRTLKHGQAAAAQATASDPKSPPPKDQLDITFEDHRAAFKSKTTWELVRAYVVYTLCSFETLVDNNMKLMKICKAVLGERLFIALMKGTFYGHFVAGEDQYKIRPVLERLRSFGVKPILDYSVEEDLTQEEAEKREVDASTPETQKPEAVDSGETDTMKQYSVDKTFADRRYKVQSARTYFYLNEATCERNMETFLKCLEAVAEYDMTSKTDPKSTSRSTYGTGITAIKLTALGRPQLLLQLSDVIMKARRYMTEIVGGEGNVLSHHTTREELEKKIAAANITDQASVTKFLDSLTSDSKGYNKKDSSDAYILHLFPWSGVVDENQELSSTFRVPDLKRGRMVRLITQLSTKEEEMFRNMIRRFNTLVRAAQDMDVRLMVDAEQTYFQPAISRLTLEFMRKYNKDKAIVFNTYQCYLRDAFYEVNTDLEQAKRQNFYFGAKLVRGAYIEQERARAAALGYNDPTNPDFDATSAMYHKTLTECLRRIKEMKVRGEDQKKIGIMVASHNEDTVRFAIEKMKEIGIEPEDKVICFGQLLAMCDYITFPLGQSGYSAYKYIPYGPVQEVLPYLSRRAQENKGVLKKIRKEKRLLAKELIRRTATGQLWYTPKGNYVPV